MLDARTPLPHRPRRVLVAGTSGSGKTTLGLCIARVLGVPHVEIDALFHGPDWTPREEFAGDVDAFSAGPAWVTEWQYGLARETLADRADLIVWLDLPRATVMRQVVRRTVTRRLRREELWNGNVEPPLRTVLTDGDHIVRWAWRKHGTVGPRVAEAVRRRPGLTGVRLRSHREAADWLDGPLRAAADGAVSGGGPPAGGPP